MTGCGNEMDETGTQTGKQVTMTMQTAVDGPQTRADYTDDPTDNTKMKFSWRSGDELSVVVDGVTSNKNCQLSTSDVGKSAAFSGQVTSFQGPKTIYAFYPYNATAYTVTGSGDAATAALTLPNPQKYTVDNGAIANSFMVGVGTASSNEAEISASAGLKQVMSIIKLNITNAPEAVKGVKLKCADAVFPTTATVKMSDATISNSGNPASELSMTVTDGTSAATKAVSFAMFPTDLTGKGITIEVIFADGKIKSIPKTGINFERNMHYVMAFDAAGAATPEYLEVNGIKVATGNLIFDTATSSVKIGAPTDNGLYFQFGSLVGWSETGNPAIIIVKPATCSVTSWSSSWTGSDPSTDPDANNEEAGTGDPCRYYLGGTWRLPTKKDFDALIRDATDDPNTSNWKWDDSSASHSSSLKFPASSSRKTNGDKPTTILGGYYWSASVSGSGYSGLSFSSTDVITTKNAYTRSRGLSVRCVRDK